MLRRWEYPAKKSYAGPSLASINKGPTAIPLRQQQALCRSTVLGMNLVGLFFFTLQCSRKTMTCITDRCISAHPLARVGGLLMNPFEEQRHNSFKYSNVRSY